MWCELLLVGFLATGAQAYHPAPIRWGGRSSNKLFLVPTAPLDGIATLKQLTLKKGFDSKVPYFTTNLDSTISCGDNDMRWCLEASGAKIGDVVRVNHCTRRPTQKWRWLPWGPIQLEGTNQCVHVNEDDGLATASVDLRECASKGTDMWMFEDTAPAPARSSLQSLPSSFLSVGASLMVAALGFGVWMWRWQRDTVMVVASKGGVPLKMNQGGVCLTVSTAARSNEMTMQLWSDDKNRDENGGFKGDKRMLEDLSELQERNTFDEGQWDNASRSMMDDRDAVIEEIIRRGDYLDFGWRYEKKVNILLLAAVAKFDYVWNVMSEDVKNNRDFMLDAVTQRGGALKFASENLKNDRDLVLAAVAQSPDALEFASEVLKNDPDFVQAASTIRRRTTVEYL